MFNNVNRLRTTIIRLRSFTNNRIRRHFSFHSLLNDSSGRAINATQAMRNNHQYVFRRLRQLSIIYTRRESIIRGRTIRRVGKVTIVHYTSAASACFKQTSKDAIDQGVRAKGASLGNVHRIKDNGFHRIFTLRHACQANRIKLALRAVASRSGFICRLIVFFGESVRL